MVTPSISRKDFIRNSSIMLVGGLLTGGGILSESRASAAEAAEQLIPAGPFRIKNVRLETGFEYEQEEVSGTRTGLFTIEIAEGRIKTILPNEPGTDAIDAKGLLMLPSFKDMHIHLDKTYYGGPWKARSKKNRTVKDMIAFEQKLMPELLKTSTERAEKLIELLQSYGTGFARSHVNIDPTCRLDSLHQLNKALDHKKDSFRSELVIFPQHGILYTKSEQWMKEAAKMNIDYIGGLDPAAVDGNMEQSMDFIVQLALEHNKGIDIHLHESGEQGLKTVSYLIDRVNENPVLKGKTFLSHCFVLAKLDKAKLDEVAEKLADARIGIVSTIPIGNMTMPIPALYRHGVDVMTGNDSIIDHWDTFGTGSILQKCNLMAQLYGYVTEFDLSRCLKLATRNILPLDDQGNRQWPKVNDPADLVLVDASCSAEAVSRVSPVRSLIHQGKIIY